MEVFVNFVFGFSSFSHFFFPFLALLVGMVRSNSSSEVGFLSDDRRTNVAVTRARRLLVVVADTDTISNHPFLRRFVEYVEWLGDCVI